MGPEKLWAKLGVFAACSTVLAATLVIHASAIPSLREQETKALRNVSALNERIGGAQKTISEILAQEKAAGPVRNELKRLHKAFPEGSATVWLPALTKEHFERFGIATLRIHLNGTEDKPGIPGYERGYWSVILPIDEAGPKPANLFIAVAEIEQRNPFVRVLDFAISPDPKNSGGRVVSLNLSALVPK